MPQTKNSSVFTILLDTNKTSVYNSIKKVSALLYYWWHYIIKPAILNKRYNPHLYYLIPKAKIVVSKRKLNNNNNYLFVLFNT